MKLTNKEIRQIIKEELQSVLNEFVAKKLREMHKCGKYYENPTCKACVEGTSSSQ